MNSEHFQLSNFCCEFLKQQLTMYCDQHGWDCPDKIITINKDKSFTLLGRNADYTAKFCPGCGADLQLIKTEV